MISSHIVYEIHSIGYAMFTMERKGKLVVEFIYPLVQIEALPPDSGNGQPRGFVAESLAVFHRA